jgi:hypothetical protein
MPTSIRKEAGALRIASIRLVAYDMFHLRSAVQCNGRSIDTLEPDMDACIADLTLANGSNSIATAPRSTLYVLLGTSVAYAELRSELDGSLLGDSIP